MPDLFLRAPHLAVSWPKGTLTASSGVTGRHFSLDGDALRVVQLADRPVSLDALAAAAGVDRTAVLRLVAAGLLVPSGDGAQDSADWSTYELLVQRMRGGAGPRQSPDQNDMPSARHPVDGVRIPLPAAVTPQADFVEVLHGRRSQRRFSPEPLTLTDLASFLRLAAAVRYRSAHPGSGVTMRPSPSGGGRHPLEIYVIPFAVSGLARGVYRFDPFSVELVTLNRPMERLDGVMARVEERSLGAPRDPAVILMITAVFGRTLWKYEGSGLSLVYQDLGALYQTCYLAATALGLGGCVIGGGAEQANARWLGLDPLQESHVGGFALGRRAAGDDPMTGEVVPHVAGC